MSRQQKRTLGVSAAASRVMKTAAESQIALRKYDDGENTCKIAFALESQCHSGKRPHEPRMLLDLTRAQVGCGKYNEAEETLHTKRYYDVNKPLSPPITWK